MLNALRKQTGSWITKAFLLLLVLSFAVWGIGDMVVGRVGDAVARVGSERITQEEFRFQFQQEVQRYGQQLGSSLSYQQAREIGVDRLVLAQMVSERTLNEAAREQGLLLSDAAVGRIILEDPTFQDAAGNFSRGRFDQLLFSIGMTEAQYIEVQRSQSGRVQLSNGLIGGQSLPDVYKDAVTRFQAEERTAEFLVIDDTLLETVGEPDSAQVEEYFENNRNNFRAPEYRQASLIILSPDELRRSIDVTDEDIQSYYDEEKDRFTAQERRRIFRFVFDTLEEAQEGFDALSSGQDIPDYAAENNLTESDYDLGLVEQSDIFDNAVAEAAFALEERVFSEPIDGQFGYAIAYVDSITPEGTSPLDDFRDDIREEIITNEVDDSLITLYDAVEDDRAAGLTFQEIARARGLPILEIPAIDRRGNGLDGTPITDLPAANGLVSSLFDAEVGIEFDPLQSAGGGSVWYDVVEIIEPRNRELDEVRDDVITAWKADQRRTQLDTLAAQITERLENGEPLPDVASAVGTVSAQSDAFTRQSSDGTFSAEAIRAVFSNPVGGIAVAAHANGLDQVVFKVTDSAIPETVEPGAAADVIAGRLTDGIVQDLLAQYVNGKQADLGIAVNDEALLYAIGLGERQHQRF